MQVLSDLPASPKTSRLGRPISKLLLRRLLVGLVGGGCLLIIMIRHFWQHRDRSQFLPSVVYYHRVKKGMTQEAVENACGRPEYAQQKNELGDEAESWYYSASDGSIEILFDEGKVRHISRE